MRPMANYLEQQGYTVLNQGYASLSAPIDQLARTTLASAFASLADRGVERIHVVTHSMGGILVRCYLAQQRTQRLGRVVMLSPPNQGSELVDAISRFRWFRLVFGPAGCQLGTGSDALPIRLGRADFSLGVITGNRPAIGLARFFPGPNDGRVSVERAQIAGMADFLVFPCGHSLIMRKQRVKEQVHHFLCTGRFNH